MRTGWNSITKVSYFEIHIECNQGEGEKRVIHGICLWSLKWSMMRMRLALMV